LKRELKKELTKLKNEKILEKKCTMCGDIAKYSIKGSSDWYCKDCAIEYFGDLKNLKKTVMPKVRNAKVFHSLNIYVAAKFERKKIVNYLYKKILEKGHSISYDWTTHKPIKPYEYNMDIAKIYSNNELSGIINCDIFIYIADSSGTTLPMEFGAALMHAKKTGKPKIYIVGGFNNKSPWFFNELVVRKDSIKEVLEEL
jgi:ribosomal protein L37AE/L43A